MSILTLPTISRTAPTFMRSLQLKPNTMQAPSPLNRANQTAELPGAKWYTTFGWRNLTGADARAVQAWLNRLSGMAGRFYLYDYTHPLPDGTALGAGLVKGASQSGRTLLTDGWTPNQSALLLPGDYIGVNGQLCRVTLQATSDSGGNSTITFEPPLRAAPADNAAIVTTRPTCVMMLVNDDQDDFDYQQKDVTNITIECMEMF